MDEWVTLEEVYNAYLDCKKRKHNTESCAIFEINLAENLVTLWEDLNAHAYKIGTSTAFCVTRPKLREVFAADFRDRIVHHLLMLKTGDLFEKEFIPNTFNCRKGKGTGKGHEVALQMATKYKDGWVLTCDIKGFFMAIIKPLLADRTKQFLRENYHGTDIEEIVWLTRMVILHSPELDCKINGDPNLFKQLPKEKSKFTNDPDKGLAIGNLTSQIYANFYLSPFDHWIIQFAIDYLRYVDDFKAFAKDKETLLQLIPRIREYLWVNHGLILHPNKISLQPVRHCFSFIGVHIHKDRTYAGNRTVGNCITMVRSYYRLSDDELPEAAEKFAQRYNSYMGFLIHHKSYALRWKIWNLVDERMKKYVYMTKNLSVLKVRKQYKTANKLKQEYNDLRQLSRRRVQSVLASAA